MDSLKKNVAGLALIAILVLVKFVVVPWTDWLAEKSMTVQQLATSVERFQTVSERKAELQQQQVQVEKLHSQLQQLWADKAMTNNSVGILKHVESLAVASGVTLSSRSAAAAVTQQTTTVPVKLFVDGTPQQVFEFIYRLESGAPLMLIHRLALNKAGGVDEKLTANIELATLAEFEEANANISGK